LSTSPSNGKRTSEDRKKRRARQAGVLRSDV
jgi:hypothetical protein